MIADVDQHGNGAIMVDPVVPTEKKKNNNTKNCLKNTTTQKTVFKGVFKNAFKNSLKKFIFVFVLRKLFFGSKISGCPAGLPCMHCLSVWVGVFEC